MRVFDLHCPLEHVFEGWFASEEDFRQQMERGLVECPMCGSKALRKGLSAPRLNLGAHATADTPTPTASSAMPEAAQSVQHRKLHALQAAWLEISRQVVAKSEDVGAKGQEPERPIRGQATPQQAMELLEEGVPVMPLALPASSKETLQ